jgi:curli production assembly/transport component CsgE
MKLYLIIYTLLNWAIIVPAYSQVEAPDKSVQTKSSLINRVNQKPTRSDTIAIDLEIDQLVVNQTLSKAGNDFYELFYSKWSWPYTAEGSFIIIISERPTFGNTTIVEIMLNEVIAYENFIQSRYDVLDELSNSAIESLQQIILNYAEVIKQLDGEDISGTGIY